VERPGKKKGGVKRKVTRSKAKGTCNRSRALRRGKIYFVEKTGPKKKRKSWEGKTDGHS